MGFTSLVHHIDREWLEAAYRRVRKDAAAGVDGQTAEEFAQNLEENLQALLSRLKAGSYRAPAVRRVHIPKDSQSSETRPIGIPTIADKVLQRAVVMLLEPIYEQDFYDGSYGFRAGRSAHQALESLWRQSMGMGGGWIVEVDIRKFFDELDHHHLRTFLKHRIRDGVLLRLIGKWLNAGVMEGSQFSRPEAGSPQGGVISPMLANIYLHYVLDQWFAEEVQPRLTGRAYLIRFADDFVIGFSQRADAERIRALLPKRFGRFGLRLHPDKTRLVDFRCPRGPRKPKGGPKDTPRSFDLLGFTHYWARSRKGHWVIKRKTAADRLVRALRTVHQWCKANRHRPLAEQQQVLNQKVHGHCSYYGITGNSKSLGQYRYLLLRTWRYWLSTRNRQRSLTWDRFNLLLDRHPICPARALHSVCRA
jgi:group II intron reverse transcriptase/maturase